ncbi:MAG: transglycosylase domain-containing protein [Patescibacteria group bacterium]|jgi:penicillin-binding protein 1C
MSSQQIRHIIQQNISRGDWRQRKLGGIFRGAPGRRPGKWKRILGYAAIICLAAFLAGSLAFIGLFAWFSRDLPDPNNLSARSLAQTTKIYDRTGEVLLYEIHGDQKRTIVDLADISPYAKNATIAAEDKDFYTHRGFSLRGYLRAFIKNILSGGRGQGGSTITQQFVKNSVLTTEKTYTRKLKELILSLEMERRFTKDQILKLYLNEIPYGSVVYGIESAAQTFLGKSAKDLTISEAALLASIPKAPTYYSPFGSHRDELVTRAHYIVNLMKEQGMISAEEAEAAIKDNVIDRIQPKREPIKAPHFVFYIKEQLADEFGEQAVERGGLKVITTLDYEKQEIAEKAVTDNLENIKRYGGSTSSLLAYDPKTGDIEAMVGSPDYFDETANGMFNNLLGKRQPGSSIKPLVYALAFEKGFTPDTVLYDVSTIFATSPKEYKPSNYDGLERGPVTMKEALAGSLNIPAVKTLYLAGLNDFLDFATQKIGYSTFQNRSSLGLSLVLGGGDVKPLEHIAAFTILPREGFYRPLKGILKVEDGNGKVLLDQTDPVPEKRVLEVETARQINAVLANNSLRAYIFGENNFLTLPDRPVAAKTGTSNDFKDAWTIGYTPSLVTGVWVGNSDGETTMKARADGSRVAAPIWNQFMRESLKNSPVENFTAPQPVVTGKPVLDGSKNAQVLVKIDKITGKLATPNTPPELVEERGFGVPHEILFFVDKNDPRGPAPADPASDPQFQPWEDGVAAWAAKQNFVIEPPPTEYDNVHLPENLPTVRITRPADNEQITTRDMNVAVETWARRGVMKVEYSLDGEFIGTIVREPWVGFINIPNRFTKGFHILTARAFDDVGNNSSTQTTINLTADPGPLQIQWLTPGQNQTLYLGSQFPYNISFNIDDRQSIKQIELTATPEGSPDAEIIGTIGNPALPTLSMTWYLPRSQGRYTLRLTATLTSGDVRTQELNVYVR